MTDPPSLWVPGHKARRHSSTLITLVYIQGRAIFSIKRLDRQCNSLLNDAREGALATVAGSLFQTDIVLEESCS